MHAAFRDVEKQRSLVVKEVKRSISSYILTRAIDHVVNGNIPGGEFPCTE
jgi:hypothetical protein